MDLEKWEVLILKKKTKIVEEVFFWEAIIFKKSFIIGYQGLDPLDDLPLVGLENKHHMRCYNLSNNLGASFSVNGQQSAFQKGNVNYVFFT